MQKDHFITVALHFSIYAAKGDSNWPFIFKSLGKLLSQNGCEIPTPKKNARVFTFFHPNTAFASVQASLQYVRRKYVSRDYIKPLPFRIIFHLNAPNTVELPLDDESDETWSFMEFGHFYVTKFLRDYLEQHHLLEDLPEHSFKRTENIKILDLEFNDPAELKLKLLFPNRNLPMKGTGKNCFYCGMTNHKPAECPSRFLTMETQGLLDIGSLTFEEIDKVYGSAFADFPRYASSLTSDITPEEIRKKKEIMALVSFFDVSCVFQLRFFFSFFGYYGTSWPQLGQKGQKEISNLPLKAGYDYLVKGRYQDAYEQFATEAAKASGKLTYAHIGLAFIAMEQGADMTNHLGNAVTLSLTNEEKIYSFLLLSRHYHTTGENQKAEKMISRINKLDCHCLDAVYRSIQLAAQNQITLEEAKKFKNLISEKKYFMSALIDPFLTPARGIVESLLLYVFQTNIRASRRHYVNACNAHKELMILVDEKTEIHEKIEKTLHELSEFDPAGKYSKIMTAAKKARDACTLCNNLKAGIVKDIKIQQARIEERIRQLRLFWKKYPFPAYFKKFSQKLISQSREVSKIRPLDDKENNEVLFKKNKELLQKIDKAVSALEKERQRMESLQNTLEYLTVFFGMLLISEGIMVCGGIALILITSALLGGKPWTNPVGAFQAMPRVKEIMFALIVFAAPVLALLLTMKNSLFKKMKKKL